MDEVEQRVAWTVCGGFTFAVILGILIFYVAFYPSYRDLYRSDRDRRRRPWRRP